MVGWREAYEQLEPEQQDRVQRWVHLNRLISDTLGVSFEAWIDGYIRQAMERPMDFSFLRPLLDDLEGVEVQMIEDVDGVSFTRGIDPATQTVSRVPLRSRNNLGRFSIEAQTRVAALLEGNESGPVHLGPADASVLQKILPGQKALSKLPKPAFKALSIMREADDILVMLAGREDPLVRMNVLEMGGVLSRPLV